MNARLIIIFLAFFSLLNAPDSLFAQKEISNESPKQIEPGPKSREPVYMEDVMRDAAQFIERNKSGYKQFKRLEQYMLNHLGADGRVINSAAKNFAAYNDFITSQNQNQRMVFAHNGSWTFLGPNVNTNLSTSYQGRVNRFAFHPTDPDIVYASTAGGGLWKTTNQGDSWFPLSDGIPVMNTSGVAVDFVEPDIIYLLSGDGDGVGSFYKFNEFTRTSIGLFKTTNGGDLWKPTGLVFNENSAILAYNLYMSPEDRMKLYVCTTAGIFRTQDGGINWDTIRSGKIYELEFKPGNANRIYCVDDNYIYISANGGDTWIDSTLIPPIDSAIGRMTITTCDGNPDLVYLLASPVDTLTVQDTLPDHRGLWLSLNSGSDFTLISTRPNLLAGTGGDEFKSQAWYDFALECNPLAANELLVGTIGMWKSVESGGSWNSIYGINQTYHADIHEIRTNPLDNMTYIATDGGVCVSPDFGDTCINRSDFLAITQYYKMATSPFFTNTMLAGAQDVGVHLRNDVETEFDLVKFGDGMVSMFHPTVDTLAITSTQNGELFISFNTGQTFTQILPENTNGDTAQWTTPLALDASDPNIIYAGFKPIMKSTDQGQTFVAISNDTISAHKILENNLSNPNRLYAGDCKDCGKSTITFEMYTSPDAGNTWERIDGNSLFPGTGVFVTDASVNPDDSDEVWISCGRYDANRKVYRSIDAGDNWTNETGTLPNVPVNAIVFEDNNGSPSGAVYIGTDLGVFYRNDDLGDWIHFSNNLPNVEVTDLDIDYNGGFVRASTYGRGLWESEQYTTCQPIISLNPSNQLLGRSYVHQAIDHVFSTALVDGYGSRVVYKSENEVHLNEGFRATSKNGAYFKALLTPCSAGGIEEFNQDEDSQQEKEMIDKIEFPEKTILRKKMSAPKKK